MGLAVRRPSMESERQPCGFRAMLWLQNGCCDHGTGIQRGESLWRARLREPLWDNAVDARNRDEIASEAEKKAAA
jgi:hypothetical protein